MKMIQLTSLSAWKGLTLHVFWALFAEKFRKYINCLTTCKISGALEEKQMKDLSWNSTVSFHQREERTIRKKECHYVGLFGFFLMLMLTIKRLLRRTQQRKWYISELLVPKRLALYLGKMLYSQENAISRYVVPRLDRHRSELLSSLSHVMDESCFSGVLPLGSRLVIEQCFHPENVWICRIYILPMKSRTIP